MNVDVYLIYGFLNAGKTSYINMVLSTPGMRGKRIAVLQCEEGETELTAPKACYVTMINRVNDITTNMLLEIQENTKADTILIEYNGMWNADRLIALLPEQWHIAEKTMLADARDFIIYNKNMRQQMYDKLRNSDTIILNRAAADTDRQSIHTIIRATSLKTKILYNIGDGELAADQIEDMLPYDINADVIEISDNDYHVFYMDISESPEKYRGKTIKMKCLARKYSQLGDNAFFAGRPVIVCCEQDIQFLGLICEACANLPQDEHWILLESTIDIKFHSAYMRVWPILEFKNFSYCDEPLL